MATAEPLRIESVVDRVYAVLRRRILDGELARGMPLRQEALADELGVSRTPLREALRRLAAEGLVEFYPNRGAQVADVAEDAVRHAYEARLVLEPGTARLAALRRPPALVAAMRQAIEDERMSTDRRSAYQASRAFHLALIAASENKHLIRAAEPLWVPGISEVIYEKQAEAEDLVETDVVEHERIVTAIEAGHADLAEALVRLHVTAAHVRVFEP